MNTIVRFLLLVIIPSLLMRCTSSLAGSGSQTSNGLTVLVKQKSITVYAQPGFLIDLLSSNYSSLSAESFRKSAIIGQDSMFLFENLNPDCSYKLLAFSPDSLNGIHVPDLIPGNHADTVMKYDSLFQTTVIEGNVADSVKISDYHLKSVLIRNTPFVAQIQSAYRFTIRHVPQGSYTLDVIMSPNLETWEGQIENSTVFETKTNTTIVNIDPFR